MNNPPSGKAPCIFFARAPYSSTTLAVMAKDYEMAVIPTLCAPWFNRLDVGTKKAGKEFGIETNMQRLPPPMRPSRSV